MLTIKIKLIRLVISAVFVVASSYGVSAQSTVFNIPSTEVQPPKHFLIELNFTGHLSPFATGGYQSYGPNIIYGVNRRMEVGSNAVYTRTSPAEPSEIQPNFKRKLYENEGNGLAVATGAVAFIPVTHRTGSTTRAMVYAAGSDRTSSIEPRGECAGRDARRWKANSQNHGRSHRRRLCSIQYAIEAWAVRGDLGE
jgi:hypothetical protein